MALVGELQCQESVIYYTVGFREFSGIQLILKRTCKQGNMLVKDMFDLDLSLISWTFYFFFFFYFLLSFYIILGHCHSLLGFMISAYKQINKKIELIIIVPDNR